MEVFNSKTGEIRTLLYKEKPKLTPKEWEILNFSLNYVSNQKQKHKIVPIVAKEFGICEKSVRRHLKHIVGKVDWLDTYHWVFKEKTVNSLGNPNHNRCLILQILKKKLVLQLKAVLKSFRFLYLLKRDAFRVFITNLRKWKLANIIQKLSLNPVNFHKRHSIYKYEHSEYLLTKSKQKKAGWRQENNFRNGATC